MRLSISGTLAVAMSVMVNNEAIKCKNVIVTDITTAEIFEARSEAKEGEYWALHELAAKTQLVDDNGQTHAVTYIQLLETSSANFKKLEELEFKLNEKLAAESLESPSA